MLLRGTCVSRVTRPLILGGWQWGEDLPGTQAPVLVPESLLTVAATLWPSRGVNMSSQHQNPGLTGATQTS